MPSTVSRVRSSTNCRPWSSSFTSSSAYPGLLRITHYIKAVVKAMKTVITVRVFQDVLKPVGLVGGLDQDVERRSEFDKPRFQSRVHGRFCDPLPAWCHCAPIARRYGPLPPRDRTSTKYSPSATSGNVAVMFWPSVTSNPEGCLVQEIMATVAAQDRLPFQDTETPPTPHHDNIRD